jgi:hypothetical protein
VFATISDYIRRVSTRRYTPVPTRASSITSHLARTPKDKESTR